DVLVFLFGMFVFGAALDESGVLHALAVRSFSRAKTRRHVLFLFMAVTAVSSAFFMNDTVAVIGTPLAMFCAGRYGIPARKMLLALCFAVTFGSAVTPIGNPQNLLVAMSGGVPFAFWTFALYLLVPSVLSLLAAFFVLARSLPDAEVSGEGGSESVDFGLARLCGVSFALVLGGIVLRVVLAFFGVSVPFVVIALLAAVPLLVFSRRRLVLLRRVDYSTLVFFAGMFILMAAVWNSGFIQGFLPESLAESVSGMILCGTVVSQFVSNVPFVLMFLPILEAAGSAVPVYMAVVAGCTAAGSLTILGAASTIIVIQHAEAENVRGEEETLSFFAFMRAGLPVTAAAVVLYAGWILGISAASGVLGVF
ncbi:MAG: SLC13 family permease, partial [Methanocorpusculum sp.]|nr:SLC13 family permease [Methanocorpusculum sp.]